jgi:carbamoyltransferase
MACYILGLSAYYHDSAAALLLDGELIAAVQEERFSRVKQDSRFPVNAVKFCLREAGITLESVDTIFYYENPYKKLNRITSTYLNFGLKGYRSFISEMPSWLMKKAHVKRTLNLELASHFPEIHKLPKIEYIDHHESHASSAFFPSPYEKAVVLCIDGVGEWATTSAWFGHENKLSLVWEIHFPHSLGLLYSAFTYFCGFKVDSGEYKLMGLAPYGKPSYYQQIMDNIIDVKPDGSFWLNMDYFDYATGNCMISDRFEELFGGSRREPESMITQREFDLAASVQSVIEDVVTLLAQSLRRQIGVNNLCLAGGVALNCVANGKLLKANIFDSIWVQPSSGDSGGALGAAFAGWQSRMKTNRVHLGEDRMKGSLLGSSYDDTEIEAQLHQHGAVYTKLKDEDLCGIVADLLVQGSVIGWFQGRMEFGPRALGARSIIGDSRNPTMQSVMNLKIKNRESFRPFAPAVLEEYAHQWFDLDRPSPYMLFVVDVHDNHKIVPPDHEKQLSGIDQLKCVRSTIPSVTHVDYSARVQTVSRTTNPRFYELIHQFYLRTNCPVVVNTSFNVRGEPIVESPSNAYACFMRTQMDYLVIGRYLLRKSDQPAWNETNDWKTELKLD